MYGVETTPTAWTFKEDFLDYVKSVNFGAFEVSYKMPLEKDKIEILSLFTDEDIKANIRANGKTIDKDGLNALYISEIRIKKVDKAENDPEDYIVLTDKISVIYPFLKQLPLEMRSKLNKNDVKDMFLDFIPNFYYNLTCDHCGNEHQWQGVDPEEDFFLEILSIYE